MLETSDEDDPNWRNKYRNPSPSPGYIKPKVCIKRKGKPSDIYNIVEDFLNLSICSEIFDNPIIEDFVPVPIEDDVVVVPVKAKVLNDNYKIGDPLSNKDHKKENKSSKQKEKNEKIVLLNYESNNDDHSLMLDKQKGKMCEKDGYFSKKKNSSSRYRRKYSKSRYSSSEEHSKSRYSSSEEHSSFSRKKCSSSRSRRKYSQSMSSSSEDGHSRSRSRVKHMGSSSKDKRSRSRSYARSYTRHRISSSEESSESLVRCSRLRSPTSKSRSYSRSPFRIESYKYDYDFISSTRNISDDDEFMNKEFIKEEFRYEEEDEYCVIIGGNYYCMPCKAVMNSKQMLYMHKNGKKHLKTLKNLNATRTLENSISKISMKRNRYPLVLSGRIRIKVDEVAFAQNLVTEKMTAPCPGLNNVIEIQGIDNTHYYCELCDSPCATETIFLHLQGFKHQINCLKHFDPETYKKYNMRKKRDIEKSVIGILRNIEIKEGIQKMVVEKEYLYDHGSNTCHIQRDEQCRNMEVIAGSSNCTSADFSAKFEKAKEPDTSMSDFYCRLCNAHMNSKEMWDKHTTGNRHIKNVKKAPGDIPSKVKSLKIPDANAKLMKKLEYVDEPIIGLRVIRETQNPLINSVWYNCHVCRSCMTEIDIIEHITSRKHKTAYLESTENEDYRLLKKTCINEKYLDSIINELCYKVNEKEGSGQPEVYVLKSAISTW